MIEKHIGPTTITVCEATAHCTIYNPTETYINEIVNDIDISNYVVDFIYDPREKAGMSLKHQIGGLVTKDIKLVDKTVDTYS
jgi:hypothetical protein